MDQLALLLFMVLLVALTVWLIWRDRGTPPPEPDDVDTDFL
jgi:hypothetical protein